MLVIISNLPIVNKLVPRRFRKLYLGWSALSWFGRGALYASLGITPEDQGSFKKYVVDDLLNTIEQFHPAKQLSLGIDQTCLLYTSPSPRD